MNVQFRPLILFSLFLICAQLSSQTPVAFRRDITIRKVVSVESDCARLAHNPANGMLYYTRGTGEVVEVNPADGTKKIIADSSVLKIIFIDAGNGGGGLAFDKQGTMYLCGYPKNKPAGYNAAMILRGKMLNTVRVWDTLAITDAYFSSISRDHLFNAVEVSPDQKYLFVNSGSRTDHGDTGKYVIRGREYPITSAMFRLPLNSRNIVLRNNEDSLKPYIFADGLRNSYDIVFAANGDLFGIDNSDVADDHEELNWIREGKHYGFPWRLSIYDNPQQYPNYNPDLFKLLVPNINRESINHNDPTFPQKPAGIIFTDPILNTGPDADHYRDTADGSLKDASIAGTKIGTFTPHGSPLAVTIDNDSALVSEFCGDMFVMTYNDKSAKKFAPFTEPGEDLLQVHLKKIPAEDRYEATVTRIALYFNYPVDAVLIKNKMYVIENGTGSSLWELTFPPKVVASAGDVSVPTMHQLFRNYPNPFNPSTTIQFTVPKKEYATVSVFTITGQEVATLFSEVAEPGREYAVTFDASKYSGGVYFARLDAGSLSQYMKLVYLK